MCWNFQILETVSVNSPVFYLHRKKKNEGNFGFRYIQAELAKDETGRLALRIRLMSSDL